MSNTPSPWRNRLSFGVGTLGRDASAGLVSMYLMFYMTEVLNISTAATISVTTIIAAMRIFDALNDPIMGLIVDNTKTRWGKFKPWIMLGAGLWAAATVTLYVDTGLSGGAFLVWFTIVYLIWSIAYTINDISFYGMLPALSRSQSEREKIGVVARICANVGLFATVVGVVPITNTLGEMLGNEQHGWLLFAAILAAIMLFFQSFTLIFTKEQVTFQDQHTPLRDLLSVIYRNDQLMWVTAAMLLFMGAYTTITMLGLHYFKYIYGDENMYPIFAAILGVTQLFALAIFPQLAKVLSRRQIHTLASALCATGLIVFWFGEVNMVIIGVAGLLLFSGQGFIQLLMMMYIADCVEYGQWKLGRRNESITVALQPFIYKASNGIASGLMGLALVISGISAFNDAGIPDSARILTSGQITNFKMVMLLIPLCAVIISWIILFTKYRITEEKYQEIISDLQEREAAAVADEPANPDDVAPATPLDSDSDSRQ